jgi:hypothetical protein
VTLYADIQSGRVDLARLAEERDGWLGLESEPDPPREPEHAACRSSWGSPVRREDFDPMGMPA